MISDQGMNMLACHYEYSEILGCRRYFFFLNALYIYIYTITFYC